MAMSLSTLSARAEARQVAPKLIEHLASYAGWPAAMSAARITKQVLDGRGPGERAS